MGTFYLVTVAFGEMRVAAGGDAHYQVLKFQASATICDQRTVGCQSKRNAANLTATVAPPSFVFLQLLVRLSIWHNSILADKARS